MSASIDVSTAVTTEPKKRGFAAISAERQREIASLGGKASHTPREGKKLGHRWTSDEAKVVGSKGGLNARGGRGALPKESK